MKYPIYQLPIISLLVSFDIWWYTKNFHYLNYFLDKGILAHIGGIVAGILVGIHILRHNITTGTLETCIKRTSYSLFLLLASIAIVIDLVVLR